MSAAPFDLGELFERVDRVRRASGQSWASLARQVGMAASTIRRFERAADAEADGVLTLVAWLGVPPEEFISGARVAGKPLPAIDGGYVRVDMGRLGEVTGAPGESASTRTSIQRLAMAAQTSGQNVASFARWSTT
jgi:transcriptional regulator with XRE-family HTH domain